MITVWSACGSWRSAIGWPGHWTDHERAGRTGARGITFGILMPGDQSVQIRAAMVARLAGRVADLASDLQGLAMLLQLPPEDDGSLAERSEIDPGSSARDVVAFQRSQSQPQENLDPDHQADPIPEADDPFIRAAHAIEALRGALRPDQAKSDRPDAGANG